MKSANADEIFGCASDEIKSTHPPSRRISSNEVGFHRRRRFHPPERVDLVEKSKSKDLLFSGLPDRIRTCDLQSRSLTRYPAVPRAEVEVIGNREDVIDLCAI